MPAFDAVLTDFDGVLRHFDAEARAEIEVRYGLPPGDLLRKALAPELLTPALLGEITEEEWLDGLVRAFGGDERAERVVAEFAEVPASVDEEARSLLAEAQGWVPVVLVTNAMTSLEAQLDRLGLAYFADDVVSSARVGFAKPDPRIYRLAAERAGAPVGRCLFVDDSPENVAAAVRLGMTGVRYTGPAALAEALAVRRG